MTARYIVWCPDYGQSREDGRKINAHSPGSAAESWARWSDASSADYIIVGGSPAEVVVAEDREGSPEFPYHVSGESMPSYRAWAMVMPDRIEQPKGDD